MKPELWRQVEEIFQRALELDESCRAEFLERSCGDDERLRREVESLLSQDKQVEQFIDSPAVEFVGRLIANNEEKDRATNLMGGSSTLGTMDLAGTAGTAIGRYHLLEKIGEGGMGEVWLAEQKEPVRRRVALKLVKAGMNTREVMVRFESERQALALMDHPAIAKVFDAGSTPQGAPYFVMEYVAGVPITAYCDNHRLSIRERLELFMHVCEGVQHAHQKAIIHRDLKPSNILVIEIDGRAAPKIIDFGVAKALTQRLTADTMFTRVGTLVGTPEYMSPEQANSSGEDIDTRTDVYSLGIIFYELLAGAPPLDLQNTTLEEFLRRLREEEPPKLSTKIRTHPATSTEVAHKRQTEPLALVKQVRGELDSIALKGLEKQRSRRYASPSDFASDIRRYLNNEAVLAVPPSVAYRARKFARRYRVALVTAGAFALVLIVAAAVSIRQSIRANREAVRANRETAVAEAVNDFLQNDLLAQASANNQSGPTAKPDPDLKVRTALDRAAERIEGKFEKQPEVEAGIRDTMGQTYMDLGLYPEARTQFERALDLQRRVLGTKDPKTLRIMSRLGRIAWLEGKNTEAEALLSQSLAIQRHVLGSEQSETLYSMTNLANVYDSEGNYAQAEALDSRILEIRRRVLGPEHPDTLHSVNNLAADYSDEGKHAQAEALRSQILGIQRRVLGPEHPDTLLSMQNLANDYNHEGKYEQAEALHSQALEIRRRVLGPEHPDTLLSMQNLANTYYHEGKYAQAEALHSQTLGIQRRVLGPEHPDALTSMNNLANTYYHEGRYAQAEALYSQTLEIRRRVLGPEHPDTLWTMSYFALMYQRQGNYASAESYAAKALAGRRHILGAEHPETISSEANLALAYVSQGKFAQSESLARQALETEKKVQPDEWHRFRAESLLGASLAGEKKYAEAEPLLLEGYQGMLARKDRIAAPDRYHLQLAHEWLVQLYKDWGKPERAAQMAKESD
jgi:eukaryotic-like serine/threonine-protein kinase